MESFAWIRFWGYIMVVFGILLTFRPRLRNDFSQLFEDAKSRLLFSTLLIIFGLLVIVSLSEFESLTQIIVAVLGWGMLIKGFLFLWMPNVMIIMMKKFGSPTSRSIVSVAILAIGTLLCLLGYGYMV